ncbi:MAG: transcriptional repressor [Deltaproteobacteria bacterium]|nr:transcriptional repressor [Deltaproteobacteria bacterium]
MVTQPSRDILSLLREHGIQPSAQRLAVAEYVLSTDQHPSADQVWERVRAAFPMLSRATVYNTLSLFVRVGLLRPLILAEGKVVFDPNVQAHHHLIDSTTGKIFDIPWHRLQVSNINDLQGFEVDEYMVVLRGRKSGAGT